MNLETYHGNSPTFRGDRAILLSYISDSKELAIKAQNYILSDLAIQKFSIKMQYH